MIGVITHEKIDCWDINGNSIGKRDLKVFEVKEDDGTCRRRFFDKNMSDREIISIIEESGEQK